MNSNKRAEFVANNKRVARNTVFLTFRMVIILLVSLYTARVVFRTLGETDFGIYGVVGSIVAAFTFLSSTLASATQRFFAVELGRGNIPQLKKTFSVTLVIFLVLALLILALGESVGLWFLNSEMNIAAERMSAARWVFHCSLLSLLATIMAIPYNAAIMAHEHMKVYAWVSLLEALLKLVIVFMLTWFAIDKLKLYAVLMLATNVCITLIYRIYCTRKYVECKFRPTWDGELFRSIFSFTGWSFLGMASVVAKNHGTNLLLNKFFGTSVNAARDVAFRVYGAVSQLTATVYTSSRPLITKYYVQDERQAMWKLVFQSTKFAYFVLFALSLPIMIEAEYIIGLWLGSVPDFAPTITRLVLLDCMVGIATSSAYGVISASGRIKRLQIINSLIVAMNIPVSLLVLHYGGSPNAPFVVAVAITLVSVSVCVAIINSETPIPLRRYAGVMFRIWAAIVLSTFFPLWIHSLSEASFLRLALVTIASTASCGLFVWTVGLNGDERKLVIKVVTKWLEKILGTKFRGLEKKE